jgi:hypothetical protein
MGKPHKNVKGWERLQHCRAQMQQLATGWLDIQRVIAAYPDHPNDHQKMEHYFLQTKSNLAQGISQIGATMGQSFVHREQCMQFLGCVATLGSLYSQSEVALKKTLSEWHRCLMGLNEQLGELEDLEGRVRKGETVVFLGEALALPRPFPWKQVIGTSAAAAAVLMMVAGAWFARSFLGIGAPEAGSGIVMAEGLSDEEQITVLLARMKSAFERADLDTLMTVFSDDYTDAENNSKRSLRALLKGYVTLVGEGGVALGIETAEILVEGDMGRISPVNIRTPQIDMDLVVTGRRVNGMWLITYIDEVKG